MIFTLTRFSTAMDVIRTPKDGREVNQKQGTV